MTKKRNNNEMLQEKISIRIELIAHLSVLGSNSQHEAETSFLKLKIIKKMKTFVLFLLKWWKVPVISLVPNIPLNK